MKARYVNPYTMWECLFGDALTKHVSSVDVTVRDNECNCALVFYARRSRPECGMQTGEGKWLKEAEWGHW